MQIIRNIRSTFNLKIDSFYFHILNRCRTIASTDVNLRKIYNHVLTFESEGQVYISIWTKIQEGKLVLERLCTLK